MPIIVSRYIHVPYCEVTRINPYDEYPIEVYPLDPNSNFSFPECFPFDPHSSPCANIVRTTSLQQRRRDPVARFYISVSGTTSRAIILPAFKIENYFSKLPDQFCDRCLSDIFPQFPFHILIKGEDQKEQDWMAELFIKLNFNPQMRILIINVRLISRDNVCIKELLNPCMHCKPFSYTLQKGWGGDIILELTLNSMNHKILKVIQQNNHIPVYAILPFTSSFETEKHNSNSKPTIKVFSEYNYFGDSNYELLITLQGKSNVTIRMAEGKWKMDSSRLEECASIVSKYAGYEDPEDVRQYCYHSDIAKSVPIIDTQAEWDVVLPMETKSFGFLACGRPRRVKSSLAILLSTFTPTTWIFLGLIQILFGIFIMFAMSHTSYKSPSGNRLYQMTLPLVVFLEQGHSLVENRHKKTWIYFISTPIILTFIVITNSFRGDNVTRVIAPEKEIPYFNFSQLYVDKFKFFDQFIDIDYPTPAAGLSSHIEIDRLISSSFSFTNVLTIKDKKYFIAHAKIVMYDKFMGDGSNLLIKSDRQHLLTDFACDNFAYLGWMEELEEIYRWAKEKRTDLSWSLGSEYLTSYKSGWKIVNGIDPRWKEWLDALKFSGISDELVRLEESGKSYLRKGNYNSSSEEDGPKSLRVKRNMSEVFIFWLVLLGVCAASFALECGLIWVRISSMRLILLYQKIWKGNNVSFVTYLPPLIQSPVYYSSFSNVKQSIHV
ncbi:hypothetical protein Fcan01_15721 [Folsomia candida]|uniref:Uncharacterized protein n=1 Tax=Folsomia candida TaxID=158441 RepID=A0A226E011_FOLCA|nr:hypothetical protein Fcan01_15721 [Folsomia candida]